MRSRTVLRLKTCALLLLCSCLTAAAHAVPSAPAQSALSPTEIDKANSNTTDGKAESDLRDANLVDHTDDCAVAEHKLKQESESLHAADGLQKCTTELAVAACCFEESKDPRRARALMERALAYLENAYFHKPLDLHEQPEEALRQCMFDLADDMQQADISLVLRAYKVYETRVEIGVDSALIRMNSVQDAQKNRLRLTALKEFLKFKQQEVGGKTYLLSDIFEGIVAVYERVEDYTSAIQTEKEWLDLVSRQYGASSDEVAREHLKLAQLYTLRREMAPAREEESLAMAELRANHHSALNFGSLGAAEVQLNDLAQKYAAVSDGDCDRALREDFELYDQGNSSGASGYFQRRLLDYLLSKYRSDRATDKELSLLQFIFQLRSVQRDISANSLRFALAELYFTESRKLHAGSALDETRNEMLRASSRLFSTALDLSRSKKVDALERSHAIEYCYSRIRHLKDVGLQAEAEDLEKQLKIKFAPNDLANAVRSTASNPDQVVLTETERREFLKVCQNPLVKHLRQAFDSFLQGCAKPAEAKLLSPYDKAYFQSPFVVLSYSNAIMGGGTISLIFQSVPDKIFYAWVYRSGDLVELRSFDVSEEDENALAQIKRQYSEILRDRAMAL